MLFWDLQKEVPSFFHSVMCWTHDAAFFKSLPYVDAGFLQSLLSVRGLIAAISIQFIWFYPWTKVYSLTNEQVFNWIEQNTCSEVSEWTLLNISGPPVQRNKFTWHLYIWPQRWSLICVSLSDSERYSTTTNLWGFEYLLQSKANWIVYFLDLSLVTCNYRADFQTFCFNQYWFVTFLSQFLQALGNW